MNKIKSLITSLFLISSILTAQTGKIRGYVTDAVTNNPLAFAAVFIQGTNTGTLADTNGYYEIKNLQPGLYNIQAAIISYKTKTAFEISITSVTSATVNFALENKMQGDTVVIKASPFTKTYESPVSLRTLNASEIERSPGGNRDISKVIQSLPGVGSSVSFRNDIIIRGGAPNENRFYLDGIEIPNINHFATQGSSGGPVGMINVNFIREVDFFSGAFPATRGNALSFVFDFKMKDGNADHFVGTATLGASDLGLTFDGPLGKKSSYIFSARRSYLQFLFKALELPFLPIYNDFQFKTKTKIGDKGELTFLGIGAIDNFELNKDANETPEQQYLLNVLPVNNQWNYAIGSTYKRLLQNGSLLFVLSRNMLNNKTTKYKNNDETDPANLIQDYKSQESENKFRVENIFYKNGWKLSSGGGVQLVRYTNSTYQKIAIPAGVILIDFDSKLVFLKSELFSQISKTTLNNRLNLSFGVRTDFTNYSKTLANPLNQISPRFSMSYVVTEKITANFNIGRYFQLPAYTILGYRDSLNNLANKLNGVNYISCNHIVAGIEYVPWQNAKISIEGFYKIYSRYPFMLSDSISLANLGADFGVIGNSSITSTSSGQAYGAELLIQQKLFKGFYGILAYTFVKSLFKTKTNEYAPSAWDNGNIITLTAGKKFKKGWDLGIRWRFQGGSPYTPFDVGRSSQIQVWNVVGQGIPDYSKLNTLRLDPIHQLDIRVDKKWFLKNTSVNLYLDIQNAYNYSIETQPYLNVVKDANGIPVVDATNPTAYETNYLNTKNGTLLPTLGVIFEF
jgi:hypothetical protein